MGRGLVIVDIQNDYFPGGASPLHEPERAADQAALLLAGFRRAGLPVFHLKHVSDEPGATFMVPGTAGIEIEARVAPATGEQVIEKHHPNGFLDTALRAQLAGAGVDRPVICGMMTAMCVDATVRAAVDLGLEAVVAHDACATRELEFGGVRVPAPAVHAAFLAALGDGYAELQASDRIAAGL